MYNQRWNFAERFCAKTQFIPYSIEPNHHRKSQARQATISKIMEFLSLSPEDEQILLKAFENYSSLPEDKSAPSDPIRVYQENRERVFRYIEMKARSISFNEEVEGIFRKSGLKYKKNYIKNGLVCDFLLENERIGFDVNSTQRAISKKQSQL